MKTTELTKEQVNHLEFTLSRMNGEMEIHLVDSSLIAPILSFKELFGYTKNLGSISYLERSLLTEEVDRNHYTRILIRVMSNDLGDFITLSDWNVRFASALQCCVALVKLKNPKKWEEILAL